MHELQCKERSQWYVADAISLDGLDGNQKKSQKRGFKTKKEAEEWYAHFMLQQSSDPTMTLADFWEIYKADMEKRLRKTTMKQKEYVMNDKVLPYFGKTPINEITAPMIRKWQGEMMEKGFKPTYLKTIHNQLSAILNYNVVLYKVVKETVEIYRVVNRYQDIMRIFE